MNGKIVIGLAIVAALALPGQAAAAISPADYKNTSKFCKALKADMGATLFKQTYGTNKNKSNAHGKCVSKNVKTVDQAHSNAAKDCKAERAADPATFAAKYGTNKNKTNAFGKCVSQKAREKKAEAAEALTNAARECKAERAKDPDAFRAKYGTNKNKRNAFGKCVSQHAKDETP
jgi:hypothetical protein